MAEPIILVSDSVFQNDPSPCIQQSAFWKAKEIHTHWRPTQDWMGRIGKSTKGPIKQIRDEPWGEEHLQRAN